jgi:carboxypeptidase C (cathepsin A)
VRADYAWLLDGGGVPGEGLDEVDDLGGVGGDGAGGVAGVLGDEALLQDLLDGDVLAEGAACGVGGGVLLALLHGRDERDGVDAIGEDEVADAVLVDGDGHLFGVALELDRDGFAVDGFAVFGVDHADGDALGEGRDAKREETESEGRESDSYERCVGSHGRNYRGEFRVVGMILRRFVLALSLFSVPFMTQLHAQRQHAGQGAPGAGDAKPADAKAADAKGAAKPEPKVEGLPEDKSVAQTITVNGKVIHYTATVGTIHLKDAMGKPTGDVMYTAYTVDGASRDGDKGSARPVLFAVNGGPGASSVYLNLGAIGPKHVAFANAGDSASDPAVLTDNPGTWLDFTDEVFIDPIGTGFSKSLVDEAETKKLFYAPTPDVEYLSLVIYKWLVKNDRLLDKKYLIGESYGGYRGPRMTHYLQSQLGVAMNGMVLVSPYLNPNFGDGNLSPIPWMTTLPSITAAHLENEHQLNDESMQKVIAYTEGEYATALIKGPEDKAATDAMIAKVTEMTGLDPSFVRYSGGRLDTEAYLREVHREKGEIGSVYDSNVTLPDPFPYAPYQESSDPILESIIAPTTTAMVNFITNTVGWKTEDRYYALSEVVNRAWDRQGPDLRRGSVPDLREAIAADPKLAVLIVHGWNDLSCPFMGSVLTQNELPQNLAKQVTVHEFPGGHMFYTRPANQSGLHALAESMVAAH